jgi:phospholipid/cholesterol/gamma-HCH transport system ATP-binding protein
VADALFSIFFSERGLSMALSPDPANAEGAPEPVIEVRGLRTSSAITWCTRGSTSTSTRRDPRRRGRVGHRQVGALRTIAGLNTPAEGEVRVLGTDMSSTRHPRNATALEARWGVMFQDGALFSSLTVRENVEVPMRAVPGLDPGTSRASWRI